MQATNTRTNKDAASEMNGVAVDGVEEVSLKQAAEMYGIPLRLLLQWKKTERLNQLVGLVYRWGRPKIQTHIFERRLGVRRKPKHG